MAADVTGDAHDNMVCPQTASYEAREADRRWFGQETRDVNPYTYQKECIGEAVSILMSLTMPADDRIAGAMGELALAFVGADPSGETLEYFLTIKQIMGNGPRHARIAELTDDQRYELSVAFWELDRSVQRLLRGRPKVRPGAAHDADGEGDQVRGK